VEPLGLLLAETYRREARFRLPPDALLPVPLHKRRLVEDALSRSRNTPQQVGLSGGQRRKNVAGAFACQSGHPLIEGRRVVLLDDVCTTGATLAACAEALLAAGAREV
jgi:predicted amidophosphoribosyltransferase